MIMSEIFKFYIVGGYVRDKLLGKKSNDIDYIAILKDNISTSMNESIDVLYDQMCDCLLQNNHIIFQKYPQTFCVKAKNKSNNEVADFVLARKEIAYELNSREPQVVMGTLYDDLMRRDFTINALALDPDTNEIIDVCGGLDDLKLGILKTPIDPNITLLDDPLRVIRGLRFKVTLNFAIEENFMSAINNPNIWDKFSKVISADRIRNELDKMFAYNTIETLNILYEIRKTNEMVYNIIFGKIKLKPIVMH